MKIGQYEIELGFWPCNGFDKWYPGGIFNLDIEYVLEVPFAEIIKYRRESYEELLEKHFEPLLPTTGRRRK